MPWDRPEYGQITSAKMDDSELVVSFADGTSARLDPRPLLPRNAKDHDIDWWRVASNSMEVIVPIADQWFEIPWDVIRLQTDMEFDAHWERILKAKQEKAVSR